MRVGRGRRDNGALTWPLRQGRAWRRGMAELTRMRKTHQVVTERAPARTQPDDGRDAHARQGQRERRPGRIALSGGSMGCASTSSLAADNEQRNGADADSSGWGQRRRACWDGLGMVVVGVRRRRYRSCRSLAQWSGDGCSIFARKQNGPQSSEESDYDERGGATNVPVPNLPADGRQQGT